MLKFKYLTSFGIAACISLTSCEDALDLKPEQSIPTETVFSSQSTAFAALVGVYSLGQQLEVFGAQFHFIQDFQSDNVEFVGSFPTFQEIYTYNTLTTNVNIRDIWRRHYQLINAANAVIENVPGINDPKLTPALKAQYIGEAKFLRAVTYLQLVTMFAQPYSLNNGTSPGVPLYTKAFNGNVEVLARNTVAQVYTLIEQDLKDAAADVPASYPTGAFTRTRATSGAAKGYLSRVYLYKGDYPNAAIQAQEVVSNVELYSLAPELNFYDKLTSEDVFTISMTSIDNSRTGAGGWASYYRPAANGGRGDCPFSDDLEQAYSLNPTDKRYLLSDSAVSASTEVKRFTKKYPDATTNADNAPMMRIAEVILTLAEALAETNGLNIESLNLLNQIRTRAGIPNYNLVDFATGADLITAILNERRLELAFEGHRRNDLLRRKLSLRQGFAKAAFGADLTILPIPQREIDLGRGILLQNPGY